MDNLCEGFDLSSVLDELNKSNDGKDMSSVMNDENGEMEASKRRVEEYILKHSEE